MKRKPTKVVSFHTCLLFQSKCGRKSESLRPTLEGNLFPGGVFGAVSPTARL